MKSISPRVLREKISNQEMLYIIDLREFSDYQAQHIPGAIHKSLRALNPIEIKRQFQESFLGDTLIVLYGEKEKRASQAYKLLESAGIKNVCILEGGYSSWKSSPIDQELRDQIPEIHASDPRPHEFTLLEIVAYTTILFSSFAVLAHNKYWVILSIIISLFMLYYSIFAKQNR